MFLPPVDMGARVLAGLPGTQITRHPQADLNVGGFLTYWGPKVLNPQGPSPSSPVDQNGVRALKKGPQGGPLCFVVEPKFCLFRGRPPE